MKQFSSQLIITNSGPPLKNGVITIHDDGTIISVTSTPKKDIPVEFYEGIIIPGFVNCHCHLEISHLKRAIEGGRGLAHFISEVRNIRDIDRDDILSEAEKADNELFREGVVLCADICNTDVTFTLKQKSSISYYNLLEIFGIDPDRSQDRIEEILRLEAEVQKYDLHYSLTPHSVYSVSMPLFRYLKEKTKTNKVTSIHFLESEEERQFMSGHTGPLRESYEKSGIMPKKPVTPSDHADTILNEITASGNLILVHNTFADREIIGKVIKRNNTYWCLCPGSNRYISNTIPPAGLLLSEGCNLVVGTDSLASNNSLSMISELKILQEYFPDVTLEGMIRWATINGAQALGEENNYGSIEPGKKPGLLLMENPDIINLRLLTETSIRRLL